MIKPIERSEIPELHAAKTNPVKLFAEEQIAEFLASGAEAAEVTGVPHGIKPESLAVAMRGILNQPRMRGRVKVVTRKGVIFLDRKISGKNVIKMPQSNPGHAKEG